MNVHLFGFIAYSAIYFSFTFLFFSRFPAFVVVYIRCRCVQTHFLPLQSLFCSFISDRIVHVAGWWVCVWFIAATSIISRLFASFYSIKMSGPFTANSFLHADYFPAARHFFIARSQRRRTKKKSSERKLLKSDSIRSLRRSKKLALFKRREGKDDVMSHAHFMSASSSRFNTLLRIACVIDMVSCAWFGSVSASVVKKRHCMNAHMRASIARSEWERNALLQRYWIASLKSPLSCSVRLCGAHGNGFGADGRERRGRGTSGKSNTLLENMCVSTYTYISSFSCKKERAQNYRSKALGAALSRQRSWSSASYTESIAAFALPWAHETRGTRKYFLFSLPKSIIIIISSQCALSECVGPFFSALLTVLSVSACPMYSDNIARDRGFVIQ